MRNPLRAFKLGAILLLVVGTVAALWLGPRERTLGSYRTSLEGRTRGQKINATRAARALDGVIIAPGHEFSFNRTVGSWTPDRGYVLAPVSYDGELVVDWGGGVCQTSSTLYNAALIAGLEVVERHRHAWLPSYVSAGRDAAVAQYTIDLRLRNPYRWPVRLRAETDSDRISFRIVGQRAGPMAAVESERLGVIEPVTGAALQVSGDGRRTDSDGKPGVRVAVYRTFISGSRSGQRQLMSQDTYPPLNRLLRADAR
jgi:vancomycin resistance protein YoaR